MKNFPIHRKAFAVAKQEAEELRVEAIKIDNALQKRIGNDFPIGKMIAANVLISLSIEIYLKAFMIAGRNNGISTGHDLSQLYKLFPEFLKREIESRYRQHPKSSKAIMVEQAFVISKDLPVTPGSDPFQNTDFDNFESTLAAISNKFVESRYFFEKINDQQWAIFKYYFEPAKIVATVLHSVLDDYMLNKFKGQA